MKQFKNIQKTCSLVLAFLLILLPAGIAAAVSMDAKASDANVQAGDTVDITITVTGKGMSIAQGVFTYDPGLLHFVEGEGASDGFLNLVSAEKGGSDTLSARIRFTAAAAGTANIAFTLETVTGYDGKNQDTATTSASVSISAASEAPASTPAPPNYATAGVLAQNVKGATESLYIWKTLENVTIPSRYTETTLVYHGETVAAAKVEDSDAPTLLYLSNVTGEAGGYYIFNEASDTLYPYRTVNSVSKSYILLEPDGSVPLPDGFAAATLMIGETEYAAWKSGDAQNEVYLLYARNPAGEVGYYIYNPADESLQRYAVLPAHTINPVPEGENPPSTEPEQPDKTETNTVTLSRTAMFLICGVAVLFLLATVGLLILRNVEKARRKRRAAQRKAERERMLQQQRQQQQQQDEHNPPGV
ncbi:hypothetical protein LJC07_07305 [Christensenellaceae bacterium OttesenSCG-928-L17]|nr:hypothetical protein [Christensenellaceae bacterium OttesenSCG-928-L17]